MIFDAHSGASVDPSPPASQSTACITQTSISPFAPPPAPLRRWTSSLRSFARRSGMMVQVVMLPPSAGGLFGGVVDRDECFFEPLAHRIERISSFFRTLDCLDETDANGLEHEGVVAIGRDAIGRRRRTRRTVLTAAAVDACDVRATAVVRVRAIDHIANLVRLMADRALTGELRCDTGHEATASGTMSSLCSAQISGFDLICA